MPESNEWPKRINFYFWAPEDHRAYGPFCLTATPAACTEFMSSVRKVADGQLPTRSYDLPEVTDEDVSHVGGGIKSWAKKLILKPSVDGEKLLRVKWDSKERTVELGLSVNCVPELIEVFTFIKSDQGDRSFRVNVDGKPKFIRYWPCFGHMYKTREPKFKFPE